MATNGDQRVTRIRDFFQRKYQEKYGVTVLWRGREQKLAKDLLGHADRNFGSNQAEFTLKGWIENYLKDGDSYLEKARHPFTAFASNPTKYAGTKPKPAAKPKAPAWKPWEAAEYRNRWARIDRAAFVQGVLNRAQEAPIAYFRGFVATQGYLRQAGGEEIWRETAKALADLIGRQRAEKMWHDGPDVVKPVPPTK